MAGQHDAQRLAFIPARGCKTCQCFIERMFNDGIKRAAHFFRLECFRNFENTSQRKQSVGRCGRYAKLFLQSLGETCNVLEESLVDYGLSG